MPQITLVDDRADNRDQLRRNIELILDSEHKGWCVRDFEPPATLAEFEALVAEEETVVLVIDERLNEEDSNVDYNGHTAAQYLRRSLPELPIFMITTFAEDDDLQAHQAVLEDIVPRNDFTHEPEIWVTRFVRAGQRYFSTHQERLQRLSELSERQALGKITGPEREELAAHWAMLGLAGASTAVASQAEVLNELRELSESAEELRRRLLRQMEKLSTEE